MFFVELNERGNPIKYLPTETQMVTFSERQGFTLIEFLITMAIIAILALIALPVYRAYHEKAKVL